MVIVVSITILSFSLNAYAVTTHTSTLDGINCNGDSFDEKLDPTTCKLIEQVNGVELEVTDTEPPKIITPPFIMKAIYEDEVVVEFEVTATDNIRVAQGPTCTPKSGSLFPQGETTVRCTAFDTNGNMAIAEFEIIIRERHVFSDFDEDGILNEIDFCHREPEIYNGYLDEDGCPDEKIFSIHPLGKFVEKIDNTNETFQLKITGAIDKDKIKSAGEVKFFIINSDGIKIPDGIIDSKISISSFGSFSGVTSLIGELESGTYKIEGEYSGRSIGYNEFIITPSTQDLGKNRTLAGVDSCHELTETNNEFQDTDGCPESILDEFIESTFTDTNEDVKNYVSNNLDVDTTEDKDIFYNSSAIIEKNVPKITFNVYIENNLKSYDSILETSTSESLDYWTQKIKIITFNNVIDINQADFFIRGGSDINETRIAFVGNESKFKKPFIEINLKKINEDIKDDSLDTDILSEIIKHEIGHMIGLSHSEDPDDIMFPSRQIDSKNRFTLELSDKKENNFQPIITTKELTDNIATSLSNKKLSILDERDALEKLPDEIFDDVVIKMVDYSLEEKQILVNLYDNILKQQAYKGSSNDSILFWLFSIFSHVDNQLRSEIKDINYEIDEIISNKAFEERSTKFVELGKHVSEQYEQMPFEIQDEFQRERLILENVNNSSYKLELTTEYNFPEYFDIIRESTKIPDRQTLTAQISTMQELQNRINATIDEIAFDKKEAEDNMQEINSLDWNENKNKLRLQEINKQLEEMNSQLLVLKEYEKELLKSNITYRNDSIENIATINARYLENIFNEKEQLIKEINKYLNENKSGYYGRYDSEYYGLMWDLSWLERDENKIYYSYGYGIIKDLADENLNLKQELEGNFFVFSKGVVENDILYFQHENTISKINTNNELMYKIIKQKSLEEQLNNTIDNISSLIELINSYTLYGFLASNPDIKEFVYELLPKYRMQESFLYDKLDLQNESNLEYNYSLFN
ncbi:MAG: matrixin family metalloprotease [Nitrosopumilus sp.]|nr:matrixin family metalloprotease [Nitrosopumilus sp.]MDH3340504.1 matrixin family metalloprotease [Nitrosopumilus sp.]